MKIFPGLTEHRILSLSYLCFFPENLEAVNDEQCECFHHNIARMGQQYQERWDPAMM